MPDYPEHDKLHAVADESQAQGDFLDWLMLASLQTATTSRKERGAS